MIWSNICCIFFSAGDPPCYKGEVAINELKCRREYEMQVVRALIQEMSGKFFSIPLCQFVELLSVESYIYSSFVNMPRNLVFHSPYA